MTIPNLMSTPVIIDKSEAISIPIPRRGSLVIIRILWLSSPAPAALILPGCGDGGIIPALVQMALVTIPTDALAAVPDEEEAACSQYHENDYEAQDRECDYHA